MPTLKNRQMQIPNGLRFYDPVLKWTSPPNASFNVICQGLQAARLANPRLSASKGLAIDIGSIQAEVDAYNTALCEQHGWTAYITNASGGGAPGAPFTSGPHQPPPNLATKLKNVAAGGETIVEWIASGAEAVPQAQANSRAATCAKCPKNDKGDWTRFFTVPVSNAIRAAINAKREMKLETPHDAGLGTCTACDCPMTLKVWVPFAAFFPKMSERAKADLNKEEPTCWIISETPK